MNSMTLADLKSLAKERNVPSYSKMTKSQLIDVLYDNTRKVVVDTQTCSNNTSNAPSERQTSSEQQSSSKKICTDGVCQLVLPNEKQVKKRAVVRFSNRQQ